MLMSSVTKYMQDHKFTREKFIEQIRMMHQVSKDVGESKEHRLNGTDQLEKLDDEQLVKVHMFYWKQL
jgi:hypothetical protein